MVSEGSNSRSSSSCVLGSSSSREDVQDAAEEEDLTASEGEERQLLLRSTSPSAAAAGTAGIAGWLQWFAPATGAGDPWQASKQQQQRRWLSPRYLACCLLYLVILCARALMRTVQLSLLSLRIPVPLLLLAVPPMAFWFKVCWRLAAAYGPVALLVSPVVGWLPLLLGLAVRSVRVDVAAGKARRRD
jgi:hypothetical protein